jgi:hypothetical protein
MPKALASIHHHDLAWRYWKVAAGHQERHLASMRAQSPWAHPDRSGGLKTYIGDERDISLRGYFGTHPLTAFARAPCVMCPATSAGSRARIRILSISASPGAMAAIVWLTVADIMLVVQKSSK